MANGTQRQFDPVASAATAALDTTQRGVRRFQSTLKTPQLPMQSQSFSGVRSVVQTASQFSPANVLATGGLPQPGQAGQGASSLPNPQDLLPGQAAQSLPNPQDLMPGNKGNARRPSPKQPKKPASGGGSSGSSPNDRRSDGSSPRDRR